MTDMTHRYENGFPKIGIRPIVDRRKLVKAALAGSTMELAHEAAAAITSVLRNPDGSPVQVVIFDTCISGMSEAARCAEQFRKEGVGVLVTVANGWCYPLETMETIQPCRTPSGDSMAPNGPVRSTWLRCMRRITRKACPFSKSTAGIFRTGRNAICQRMLGIN